MNNLYWISIIPPLLTIGLAIYSKKIIPSLLVGLLMGGFLVSKSFIGGIESAINHIVDILSDKDNLQVLLFLYLFNGLISLIKNSGGIKAFSSLLSKYIKSARGVFYILWALIPVTFIDCDFRIIGSGSIIRSLAEKNKIAKERLAFMINNTASPVVELIPIATTFVGFNIANIGMGLKFAGIQNKSAYGTLLQAIPFEFFSIVILIITFLSIYFQFKKSFTKKHMYNMQHMHKESSSEMKMDMSDKKPEIKPRIINLIIPMLSVVSLSFFFYWYFGISNIGLDRSISSIISATDPNMAMLVALSLSIFITGLLYSFQKYSPKKMIEDMISGGNELVRILIILVIAWSLGAVSQELGLSDFIRQLLGSQLPAWSVPVSIFLVSSAVTYFIGEGWAAASLIMPFALSIAVSSGAAIPICVAAVITGGTFGDVTSPVAGMTNMASEVSGSDHMKYLKYATPYNLTAAGISTILFLIFGFIL